MQSLRGGAILLGLCCLACVGAEEAFGKDASFWVSEDTAKMGRAGYHPNTDVLSQMTIDQDIRDIFKAGMKWADMKKIYMEGKNSQKSDGSWRTLRGFSTYYQQQVLNDARFSEPFAKLGIAFWGRGDYADAQVMAALDGRDLEGFGMYGSGPLAKTDAARQQIVRKVIQFSAVWLYAFHEVELALKNYKNQLDTARFVKAQNALNEAWVFYVGSLEDGKYAADEVDGEGLGYAPYTLAESRAIPFKTNGYIIGTGGSSRTNMEILYQFTAMQRYLATAGNEKEVDNIAKCLRAQWKVPSIQACVLYSWRASNAKDTPDASLSKIKAEAWAFCQQAATLLHEVDPQAAADVKKHTMLDSTSNRPDFLVIKNAFRGANINKMGLKCSDIGGLDEEAYGAEFPACDDDRALMGQNTDADSAVCAFVRMPPASSSVVTTASSWLMLAVASGVTYVASS